MRTPTTPPKNIDEYIAGYPPDVQAVLQQLRQTIREAAPEAQEAISYQMPTFKLHGNLVHFAAYQNHIGFYPASSGIEQFKGTLSAYETSKGTVRFPIGQPIPFDLVSQIVKYRVLENAGRAAAKKKLRKTGSR